MQHIIDWFKARLHGTAEPTNSTSSGAPSFSSESQSTPAVDSAADLDSLNAAARREAEELLAAQSLEVERLRARLPPPDAWDDARRRFLTWRYTDPFPNICPGLLNCADFCDYVATTGMIFPFHANLKDMKMAGYDLRLAGEVVFWERGSTGSRSDFQSRESDIRIQKLQTPNDSFTLRPNSIAFVTLEPFLQLPDYIALRFNLRATNVYRGLLLGTGPLVDPGYQGRLSFPLHNLTSNEYTFCGGEPIITVEFTKLTPRPEWALRGGEPVPTERCRLYIPYLHPEVADPDKTERNVHAALKKADPQRSVQSSIPLVLYDLQRSAKEAEDQASRARRAVNFTSWATIIAVILALASLGGTIAIFFTYVQDFRSEIRRLSQQDSLTAINRTLRDSIQKLLPQQETGTQTTAPTPQPGTSGRVNGDTTRQRAQ